MTVHGTDWFAEQISTESHKRSADWVRKNLADIPHRRIGRTVAFTDADLAEYLESQAVRPVRMQTTGRRRSA